MLLDIKIEVGFLKLYTKVLAMVSLGQNTQGSSTKCELGATNFRKKIKTAPLLIVIVVLSLFF